MLGFILETIVLTFLLLLFGEIMPKDLRTEKLAAVRAQFGPCTECRGACLPAAFEHIGHVDQRHQQGVSQEEVRSFGR